MKTNRQTNKNKTKNKSQQKGKTDPVYCIRFAFSSLANMLLMLFSATGFTNYL